MCINKELDRENERTSERARDGNKEVWLLLELLELHLKVGETLIDNKPLFSSYIHTSSATTTNTTATTTTTTNRLQ